MISVMYSFTALTDPGSVYTRVLPIIPAIPLLNNAEGLVVPYLILMNSIIPGISFVSFGEIVSTVISLGPIPVPPVVNIKS